MADEKIKIQWVTQHEASSAVANALGYGVHNSQMKKHCAEHFEYCDDARIAVTITPADQFRRVPGKFNILFTMWEAKDVPDSYLPGLRAADLVVVPCEFCREIFQPLTPVHVVTCFEGVDRDVFEFHDRSVPDFEKGERFRYLWLGAPNPRKGYYSVLEFVKLAEKFPNIEVYLKTTTPKNLSLWGMLKLSRNKILRMWHFIFKMKNFQYFKGEADSLRAAWRRHFNPQLSHGLIVQGKNKNVILDSRKISNDEMAGLYHSAHCFLSPHSGEGWGLTLCEAMATGCPSVASESTGVLDFFDKEVGYPVKCDIVPVEMRNYNIKARTFVPDTRDFFKQALDVYQDYKEALRRGKKASYRIRTNFTWKKSAKRFAEIVNEYCQERVDNGKSLSVQESEDRQDNGARLACAAV